MASTTDQSQKTAPECGYGGPARAAPNLSGVDLGLRLLLFASTVSALVVLVTSKQTEMVPTSLPPPLPQFVARPAKFQHSPAFIYLLVALSVTCLYSIITMVASFASSKKPTPSAKLLCLLIITDTVMAGLMASATGTSGAVAYIGLKGNSHTRWNKVCNVYGKFCRHIGSSTFVSLVAAIVLVLLVLVSSYSFYRRNH